MVLVSWWMMLVLCFMEFAMFKFNAAGGRVTQPQVPCFFIFGDSLADSGNNNNLQTLSKADYSPYGIDFPGGPTGRFCNGRTVVDAMAQILGFDNLIPPFATAIGTGNILSGVNYASSSAGIRDETGMKAGERIPFNMQLQNHRITVSRLADILGSNESASWYLSKCLYYVGMGSNDYINNYFLPQYYPAGQEYTLEQYTQLLIEQYSQQLRSVYEHGARKIAIFGLGKIGCTPNAIHTYGTDTSTCVEIMNNASQLFNSGLISAVDQLNDDFTDAKFTYLNQYKMGTDSAVLGFKVVTVGCCPVAEDGRCIPNESPCDNRTEYAFWDAFHPSETLNLFAAARSYSASDELDAYPNDIRNLLSLNQEVAAFRCHEEKIQVCLS